MLPQLQHKINASPNAKILMFIRMANARPVMCLVRVVQDHLTLVRVIPVQKATSEMVSAQFVIQIVKLV